MAGCLSKLVEPGQVCVQHNEIVSAIVECNKNGGNVSGSTLGNHNKYILTGIVSCVVDWVMVTEKVTVELVNDLFEVELTMTITDALDRFLGDFNAQTVMEFEQFPDGSVCRHKLKQVCGSDIVDIEIFRVGSIVKPFVRIEVFEQEDLVLVLTQLFA
jgi:hypothetical protein